MALAISRRVAPRAGKGRDPQVDRDARIAAWEPLSGRSPAEAVLGPSGEYNSDGVNDCRRIDFKRRLIRDGQGDGMSEDRHHCRPEWGG